MLLGSNVIVVNKSACKSQPFFAVEAAEFYLGSVCLLENVFAFAGLDIELAFEKIDGSEGPYSGLIDIDGCQIVCSAFLDELVDYFHVMPP